MGTEPAKPLELVAVATAVEGLTGLVSVARALVEAGREVDLTGLDGEAARVCAALACLPADLAGSLLAPLDAAVREVDALRAALRPG